MRPVWLIARSVLIEAIRRREIYAIVFVSILLIAGVMSVDFFEIEGLSKFYREIALHVMSLATALTCIVLAARQLPREFESRTIYPLLARPISRTRFLAGKLLGVMLACGFCFAMFMGVYLLGVLSMKGAVPKLLFIQYIYLQMLLMLILATLSFWLSMMLNLDAAITLGGLFYLASEVVTNATSYLYDFVGPVARGALIVLNFVIPQLTLFDLSGKAIHAEAWGPLSWRPMLALTIYGGFFAAIYFGFAIFSFRRKPL